ncbi:hypothetical protein JQ559_30135 [Bradyrhizobium viridifuturi]|jgi:hypothetical protein|uniref:hypothetical protein n=1 Tax=Bradyrhizobium TaxID=374 RepID=UPI001304DD83|nr:MULTISPECIES: hypothetical protein [Bradyrhizobium]QRI70205.1 hypothetical protein JQ507_01275 [Bradyrhizobium sp. PSBB068]MBR1023535.1 hypothetical protein [Bradyrhizobium viridifuturi]MBR1040412.1 hypothetical protein [Bradyrhizobium viridifuturi]MBR1047923.1 hypothetical protein [Bradyrhizobium viridifuturi]MBR1077412.1 hypothetical protein [Bradyrhizobium viridifuturi]
MIRKSAKRFSGKIMLKKGLKRDDDSTQSHRALEAALHRVTSRVSGDEHRKRFPNARRRRRVGGGRRSRGGRDTKFIRVRPSPYKDVADGCRHEQAVAAAGVVDVQNGKKNRYDNKDRSEKRHCVCAFLIEADNARRR